MVLPGRIRTCQIRTLPNCLLLVPECSARIVQIDLLAPFQGPDLKHPYAAAWGILYAPVGAYYSETDFLDNFSGFKLPDIVCAPVLEDQLV
jgi:hypothetical protein